MNDTAMRMILKKDELERIGTTATGISVDLHKLTVKDARRLVRNIIAVNREQMDMTVIHGYNHGTAIKDMLRNDTVSNRIAGMEGVKGNMGRTILHVAAA